MGVAGAATNVSRSFVSTWTQPAKLSRPSATVRIPSVSKRLLLSHKRDTGPWLLCSAKILRGRKITCFHAIKVRLIRTNTQLAVARHHNAPTPPGRRGKRWSGVGRSRSRRRQEPHHVTHPQRPAGWLRALTVLYFLSHHLHRELVSQAFCKAIIECATIGVGGVSA